MARVQLSWEKLFILQICLDLILLLMRGEIDETLQCIRNLDSIDEERFKLMAARVGIGEKIAMTNYHKVLDRFENAVKESARELRELGFDNALDIAERIIMARKKVL